MQSSLLNPKIFTNKVFVVTGGGQGIGNAITQVLRGLSARVVVLEHPELAEKLTGEDVIGVDLSDHKRLGQCIPSIVSKYGHCDGLINNARAGLRTSPLKETAENVANAVSVGITASTLLSQQLIQHAKTEPDREYSIINLSSASGSKVSAESISYHMTKSAIESMTRYFAAYGGEHKVRVNAIAPGFIVKERHSERFHSDDNSDYRLKALIVHPLGKVGTEEDVANAAAFLLSDAAAFITGHVLAVDGGLLLRDSFSSLNSALEKVGALNAWRT